MRRVLELPAFRRLLASAMLNELAASIGTVALSLLVYRRTGSALGAAAFFLCSLFGPALASPLFVARLDQRSARLVLTAIYALEGVVFLVLAWVAGRFALAPVLALALVDGLLALTARVLARAAWTSVAGPAGLMREANALVNASYSVCFMIGPALGGAAVAIGGTVGALLVNSGVLAVIALTIATARGLPPSVADRAPVAGRLRAALAQVREQPMIRRLLALEAAGILFFTISIPVEVVFAQHSLHAGAGGYGILLSAWGAGALVGSAIYARWRRLPSRELIALGTASLGVGFIVMAAAPSLAIAVIGAVIAGIGNGIQVVAVRTALQEATAERWMALMLSLNESIFQAVPGAGILLGGAIASLAGPRVALATGAAGSLGVAAAIWVRLRPAAATGEAVQPTSQPDPAGLSPQ
jgi:predicted MFS family arabinose efflux permease